jgi:hypothetical protein
MTGPHGAPDQQGSTGTDRTRSLRRQLELVAAGYVVVTVFLVASVVLGVWQRDLSTAELLAVAAVIAAPPALALLSDRLISARIGPVEVSFAEVSRTLDLRVADQFQRLDALVMSDSPQILEQVIASMRGPEAPRLLGVNLKDGRYWWSTRLFLLAALADDFTGVETIVFVAGGADARYVGMASPASLRRTLDHRFTGYEVIYRWALDHPLVRRGTLPIPLPRPPEKLVADAVRAWSNAVGSILGLPAEGQPAPSESDVKELVGRSELVSWLAADLDTRSVEWDGLPLTDALRYRIVGESGRFVALAQRGRLAKVIDRVELATRISQTALEYVIRSGRR